MARVLFIEPFYGGNHRAFADGLRAHSSHEVKLLTLPEGEWRRRMRSGAQELAPLALDLPGRFDLIIATDMLDLPAFLALTRRRFGHVPVLLYMHENQFTYPRIRGTKFNSWFGQVNYLSALTVDAVAFNSAFHRDDFIGALDTLAAQPNNWLIPGATEAIAARTTVLSVGVDLEWLDAVRPAEKPRKTGAPLILWNHRWEFDKAPELFARALLKLRDDGVDFRVAIAGDPGLNPSPAVLDLPAQLGERVVQFGRVADRTDYARLLWESDIAVSTTRHEFFGIGMVEAMYCGCIPLAPARYNYPALVPADQHAACLWEDEPRFDGLLRALLQGPRPDSQPFRAAAARFAWREVIPAWDEAIDALAGGGVSRE